MTMAAYKLYPSLLDTFARYELAEGYMKERCRKELMNAVNRVPFASEAKDTGTAFNAIIDCYVHDQNHTPSPSAPCTIDFSRADNAVAVSFPATDLSPARRLYFNRDWCRNVSRYFEGADSQVYVSAHLDTLHGDVELYGFIDEVLGHEVYDIKTPRHYHPGKYASGWQRHVYPYCLTASGKLPRVDVFEYTAFELKGGTPRAPLISGTCYQERYPYDHEESTAALRTHVTAFIEFLENNRESITNQKIFVK